MRQDTINFPSLGLTLALGILLLCWVHFYPETSPGQYAGVNLFNELKPRALLGTVANLFHLSPLAYSLLKLGFLGLWAYLVIVKIYQCLHVNQFFSGITFIWVAISFLFVFSPVSYLTINLVYIDSVAYALTLSVLLLAIAPQSNARFWEFIGIWCLGFAAILVHEKSVFDLGILGVWLLWQRGFKDALFKICPPIVAGAIFLYIVSNKVTWGLKPQTYIQILLLDPTAILADSFNVWGILFGGGALWIFYCLLVFALINQVNFKSKKLSTVVYCILMALLCIAPLIVASDTNRMVDLIWMPCLLLICTLQWPSLFSSISGKILLVSLCAIQLLTPPFLMYNHGVVPMNCYASYFARQLPLEAEVKPRKWGVFSLHVFYRSDTSQKACDGL